MIWAILVGISSGQDPFSPSLLGLPPSAELTPVSRDLARDARWYEPLPTPATPPEPLSPSDRAADPSRSIRPDVDGVIKGGWDGDPWNGEYHSRWARDGLCRPPCCPHDRYIQASALAMTMDLRGGFVVAVDSATFDPVLQFCDCEPPFEDRWQAGFEVSGGRCFGPDCRSAVELVYWGLYDPGAEDFASGSLNSLLDFSDLDYLGANANTYFVGAAAQRVQFQYDFHSVELNLIGNNRCGGPLGGGRCGGCAAVHHRFGFGWMAGLRYLHLSEDWLFSTDSTDTVFDESGNELSYEVDLDNNLFGFQMGAGLNGCVARRLQAVAIGRVGVYGNSITKFQRIYGPAGNAVLNSGPFSGNEYLIEASDAELAVAGQFDLGGRWMINRHWTFDFGYRVLGIAGVAVATTNVTQRNFQNVFGASDPQTGGSLLLHGGYLGLSYCW